MLQCELLKAEVNSLPQPHGLRWLVRYIESLAAVLCVVNVNWDLENERRYCQLNFFFIQNGRICVSC
jgi:hypothetical protein